MRAKNHLGLNLSSPVRGKAPGIMGLEDHLRDIFRLDDIPSVMTHIQKVYSIRHSDLHYKLRKHTPTLDREFEESNLASNKCNIE